ncbi:aldo/keto reductase [Chitinophaga pendula]|uniref:aldo/keto reductase n=1 Tax=Chitinophaga TaxID=79328 RepID=UPI000BAEC4A8|nr:MULTISPECIES: aldo/keto reductase [Chitinophaga]ASZ11024.1 oxidoreductase [Chitinophaga sp. MD30]UCJ05980.1 aldo/keto reductase [Chitinophaga pendula]
MEYHLLGKSSLRISRVGFGCMSLGNDDKENDRLIGIAVDKGINLFDTADLYDHGQNEMSVGKALKQKRGEVVLATKVGNQWRPDGSGWDWNPSREYILKAVEDSLRRLQTDYIDLYQLHGGTIEDTIDDTIAAFEILKQQGKIRYYGISSIRPNVIREYVQRAGITSVMMQYSLLDRRPEESCLPLLQQHEIGVLARGSVAKGLLAGKAPGAYLDHDATAVHRAAEAINNHSGSERLPAQTAIRYALHHPAITSAIVGIRTLQQLEEAAELTATPPLSEKDIAYLQAAAPALQYDQHR